MTEQEKKKIKTLRKAGMGYKSIASELNISLNTIKSFCQRNNLGGCSRPPQKRCLCCGKRISTGRADKKYCSADCRYKFNNERKKHFTGGQIKLECHFCGKEFHDYPKRNRKFCSNDCYLLHRFGDRCII